MPDTPVRVRKDEFFDHNDNYDGFCRVCLKWTRDGSTEPDARRYKCPVCGQPACFGAEEALIMGLITID